MHTIEIKSGLKLKLKPYQLMNIVQLTNKTDIYCQVLNEYFRDQPHPLS
jgi:hypothetical protein